MATVAFLAFTDDRESGVEVGETFTATVESYYGPDGPEPHVVCFDREVNCGLPVLADAEMPVQSGQRVTVTELRLDSPGGDQRVAFYVHAPAG